MISLLGFVSLVAGGVNWGRQTEQAVAKQISSYQALTR